MPDEIKIQTWDDGSPLVVSGMNYIAVCADDKVSLVTSLRTMAVMLGATEYNKLSVLLHYKDERGDVRELTWKDLVPDA